MSMKNSKFIFLHQNIRDRRSQSRPCVKTLSILNSSFLLVVVVSFPAENYKMVSPPFLNSSKSLKFIKREDGYGTNTRRSTSLVLAGKYGTVRVTFVISVTDCGIVLLLFSFCVVLGCRFAQKSEIFVAISFLKVFCLIVILGGD